MGLYKHGKRQLWLEGMQQKLEANNTFNLKPIRVCFINVYTYPNHKPTPYNNAKTVIFKVNKTDYWSIFTNSFTQIYL